MLSRALCCYISFPFDQFLTTSIENSTCNCEYVTQNLGIDILLKYKIAAILSILIASAIGVTFPIVGKNFPILHPQSKLFFLIKSFAAGVILSTGFIHILPDAFEDLNSPTLKDTPWGKFPFTGLAAMVGALGSLMIDAIATGHYRRAHFGEHSGSADGVVVEETSEEHAGHVHLHTHATHGHAHGPGPLEAIQRLDLSFNSFEGNLPDELGTLLQLELLMLSENKFSGNIPAVLGNLTRLTELQMGGNSLSGRIPSSLGSLSSLQIAMNLSYNNLSGTIPSELGNLILLEYLYLNNNHLTGEIPSTFGDLSSLLGVNFSYNDLTGPIPSMPLFQTMESSSFLGNKDLCGQPLASACNDTSAFHPFLPPKNAESSQGKTVTIIAVTVGGISLILIVVILFYMRRPVETVASVEENADDSSVSDIYFPPKEGFTFHDLIVATSNFHESYVIGKGACGTVYKAVMHTGLTIAVKRLASNREGNNIENSFRAEILTLGKIRHRNIVKLYGFCYNQGSNLLLYEYMSRGSLGEVLHGSSCSLDWPTRFSIALGSAQGLAYLHHDCKPRIIHRDIKSNNILLDDKFEAHVGDFGLAKVVDMPQSKSVSAVAGSYGYIAPEYAYTMKVTEKCDIYSYGVVLLELLTGRTPVQPIELGGDLVNWAKSYIRSNSLTPGILDDRLNLQDQAIVDHMLTVMKLALLCTNMSPFDRPSMREVVLMLIESNQQNEKSDSPSFHNHDIPLKENAV